MSNTTDNTSKQRYPNEPEWVSSWRAKEKKCGEAFPQDEKYGIAIQALSFGETPDFSGVPEYSVTPSKGLELYTWNEAIAQEEIAPFLERLLMSELLPKLASRLSAEARSAFHSGLVVYVQPTVSDTGEQSEETLELTSMIPLGSASDLIIVIAKEGSRLKMADTLSGGEDTSTFARTFIVLSESGARVDISVNTSSARGFVFREHIALLPSHSECRWLEDPASEIRYRSRTVSILLGEEARSEITHLLLGSGTASYDIYASVEHRAGNTHSRVFAVGAGAGSSKTVYRGMILMNKGAQKVDGAQEGKFLILSPNAEIDAIPELNIASCDVLSSHKLSVTHVRPSDLFYAKTRGIPEEDAREISVEGFFGSLLSDIGRAELLQGIKERIMKIAHS